MNKKKLTSDQLYHRCDPDLLNFSDTSELESLDHPLGQERALEAIEFGVDIDQSGFNLFVHGASGLGKDQFLKNILEQRAAQESAPFDWCYVNNFDDPQRPKVLKLPAGMGHKLRVDMEKLVEDLLNALPSSFQSEEYRTRIQEIHDEFQDRKEQAFAQLDKDTRKRGIALLRTPAGYTLSPMQDEKLLEPEEYEKLPEAEQERIEKLITDIQLELRDVIRHMPLIQREHNHRVKSLRKEITKLTVDQLIGWLESQYQDQPNVRDYIIAVKNNVIEYVQDFLPEEEKSEDTNIKIQVENYPQYSINVLVSNSDEDGAPVIFEDNPSYQNLIGRIEHVSQMGTLLTDFTLIKAGALHRANGGYLILDARKVLTHALAWDGLKRVLSSHEVKIESLEQMLSLVSTISLEPESIPINVKVILTGEPLLYYLLKEYDPEFNHLFKVSADFSEETVRNEENTLLYARMIASILNRQNLKALGKAGVARVIEHAARLSDDGEKLSLHVETLADLLNEANYWSGKAERDLITLEDIDLAIEKRRYRQDRIREQVQEHIHRGIQLIDTSGEKVGQLNGLSVLQIGDYAFGRPSRITATARLGQGKVIDIEREVKLGGHIHSKGVLILSSYLANHYARNCPLPLSASLVFEQSYGMIDGDSASAAELCVLLSALGEVPLKQSIALTGSINQLGEIQAIGGANEKIEGYFDICQKRGLDGSHGVIIPASNQVHLMLRKDVREAVAAEKFTVHTAQHVEDVMEILSGLPRGTRNKKGEFSKNSFNRIIQDRITELQNLHRKFAGRGDNDKQNGNAENSDENSDENSKE